jgi:hypothetical protein
MPATPGYSVDFMRVSIPWYNQPPVVHKFCRARAKLYTTAHVHPLAVSQATVAAIRQGPPPLRVLAVRADSGKQDVHWAAVLVEGARVKGKPVQHHIAYLGGITESAIEIVAQRCSSGSALTGV